MIITFDDISFCCISKWNWSDEYSVRGRIQKFGEGGNGAWILRQSEPGPETEKKDAVRNMSMKRRRD